MRRSREVEGVREGDGVWDGVGEGVEEGVGVEGVREVVGKGVG